MVIVSRSRAASELAAGLCRSVIVGRHGEQVGDLRLADKFRRKRHPLLFDEAITGALGGVEAALAFGTLDPRINDRAQFDEMIWPPDQPAARDRRKVERPRMPPTPEIRTCTR